MLNASPPCVRTAGAGLELQSALRGEIILSPREAAGVVILAENFTAKAQALENKVCKITCLHFIIQRRKLVGSVMVSVCFSLEMWYPFEVLFLGGGEQVLNAFFFYMPEAKAVNGFEMMTYSLGQHCTHSFYPQLLCRVRADDNWGSLQAVTTCVFSQEP